MLPRLMGPRYFPAAEIAAALLAGFSSFVEVHIWSPAYTYFLLLALVVMDTMLRNKLLKRRTRPLHMGIILLAYTFVMAFAHGFGGHEIGLRWLPQVVLAPLVVFHLRRFIVNLSKIDLMDEDVATLLSVKILKRQESEELRALAEPDAGAESSETGAEASETNSLEPAA